MDIKSGNKLRVGYVFRQTGDGAIQLSTSQDAIHCDSSSASMSVDESVTLTLSGQGELNCTVTNFGTVQMGSLADKVTVNQLDLGHASSVFKATIDDGNNYNSLSLTRCSTLGGTLSLNKSSTFFPSVGQKFPILNSAANCSSGSFASIVNQPSDAQYCM
eukprot:TRINITY_DN5790_c0_g1_i1.p1 TRINITY_DN5790_c0_g1~~TRINITY_DN5790_c0_g1_i1.p1  ORF type:complete len:160 (+),score=35.24 TRINITY_DN5790_c0_g1_i1:177-656(+)